MNLHEYQAKQVLRRYGLPVAEGIVASNRTEAEAAIDAIAGERWVVKVQAHAGGRGKAGGVQLVSNRQEAGDFAEKWLNQRLVTYQTGEAGVPVSKILVEPCCDIATELYLAALLDRDNRCLLVMASTEGGVEIEQVARENPDAIVRQSVNPMLGPMPWQGREMARQLGLNAAQSKQFVQIFTGMIKAVRDCDLSLVEVNPLVITTAGDLFCLDAKINVDGNALHRQKDIEQMHDPLQEDEREAEAARWELNYVALDGDIGCMVNGAGLAMATMDLIKLYGASPANFLDVGGGATRDRVTEAFKIILSDQGVKAVLVNIFGGIVRCDLIAEGIVAAIQNVGVKVPVVVRLQGNQADAGSKILSESGLNIHAHEDLSEAARAVISLAGAKV